MQDGDAGSPEAGTQGARGDPGNLERAERRKAPERDLEALRSKVDFWETVCAEIGAGESVEG